MGTVPYTRPLTMTVTSTQCRSLVGMAPPSSVLNSYAAGAPMCARPLDQTTELTRHGAVSRASASSASSRYRSDSVADVIGPHSP